MHGSRRRFLSNVAYLGGIAAASGGFRALHAADMRGESVSVRQHGAAGDGTQLDTVAIQAAVDACAKSGGGVVYFPPGTYRSGTIRLRSRVTLHLSEGSKLLGSTDLSDYPVTVPQLRSFTDTYTDKSLLYAEAIESAAIEGLGTIDGQGAAFQGPYKVRPYLIRFVGCRDVTVRHVTILNSPMWVQHYLACEGVYLHDLKVRSRVNSNNDGIDIDCCRRVRISDCDISSGDDAIVLKSTSDRPCRDVVVADCILSSNCNALKLGTESNGGFENIVISNCSIYETRLAGIALECVDGGTLDRVQISNIAMRDVKCPIFLRLGDRGRPFLPDGKRPGVGRFRNVVIQGIQASGAGKVGCSITGLPGQSIENVTLRDVSLSFEGGGTQIESRREIPEFPDKYPEFSMFGVLPAYGFYCRHARELVFDNVRCACAKPDLRPALVCDDVESMDLSGLRASAYAGGDPLVRLKNVKGALIRSCRADAGVGTFLELRGRATAGILLTGNDLRHATRQLDVGPEVAPDAVKVIQ